MKIAWHCWEPGVFSSSNASSGGGTWMRLLLEWMRDEAIQVYWLTSEEKERSIETDIVKRIDFDLESLDEDIDLLYLSWRWFIRGYPERNMIAAHQWLLMEQAADLGIPVLIHDQDHKMLAADFISMNDMELEYTVASPAFFPPLTVHTLMFPHNIGNWNDERNLGSRKPTIGYVGNNYERYKQSVEFFVPSSRLFETNVWGNWLEPSDNRESPEKVQSDMPFVNFKGRCTNDQVYNILKDAKYTVHLAKPTYNEAGFMTMRWAEAAAAGCLAFIPSDFKMPQEWRERLKWTIVKSGYDMMMRINQFEENPHLYDVALSEQRQMVKAIMRRENWTQMFDDIVDGILT